MSERSTEPVGGHRRNRDGTTAYGRPPRHKAKPEADLYMPGLTLEAALTIGRVISGYEVVPDLQRWALPKRKLLHDRREVTAMMEQRTSPPERAVWTLMSPFIGRMCLSTVQHARPGRAPYESLAEADRALSVRPILERMHAMQPAFTALELDTSADFVFHQSTATAGLPTVVRTVPIIAARRNVTMSTPDQKPLLRGHVARLALCSAFVVNAEWQVVLFDSSLAHGEELVGDVAQTARQTIAAADPEVLAPIASSLVLTQAWPPATVEQVG